MITTSVLFFFFFRYYQLSKSFEKIFYAFKCLHFANSISSVWSVCWVDYPVLGTVGGVTGPHIPPNIGWISLTICVVWVPQGGSPWSLMCSHPHKGQKSLWWGLWREEFLFPLGMRDLGSLGPALQLHLEHHLLLQDGPSSGWIRTKWAGLRGISAANPSTMFSPVYMYSPHCSNMSSLKVTTALLVLISLVLAPSWINCMTRVRRKEMAYFF